MGKKSEHKKIIKKRKHLHSIFLNKNNIGDIIKNGECPESKNFAKELFDILVDLNLDEDQAWQELLKLYHHQKTLSKELNREIDFRVSLLDYFLMTQKLVTPKIIELDLYNRIKELVLLDDLTPVYNKRYFSICLNKEYKYAKRNNTKLSFMILDLDNFKQINDNFGHQKGDEILLDFCNIIKKSIREEDTACRLGGDEFCIIMRNTSSLGALKVGDRIKNKFSKIKLKNQKLSVSGGIATFPDNALEPDMLYNAADKNLYKAKKEGRNKIFITAA